MNNLFISLATDKGISTFHSPEEIEALNLLLIKRGCYVIGDETHLFDPVCLFIKYTEPGFANPVSFSEWLSFSANIALLFPQKQIRVLPATKALAETLINVKDFVRHLGFPTLSTQRGSLTST